MSVNRRRWSNDLITSLMDFQSREASQLSDSVDEECTDITAMLSSLQIQKSTVSVSSREPSEGSSSSTLVLSDSGNSSQQSKPSSDVLNRSIIEDILISKKSVSDTLDFNERLSENIDYSSDSGTLKPSSNCSNNLLTESENSQISLRSLKEVAAKDQLNNAVADEINIKDKSGEVVMDIFDSEKEIQQIQNMGEQESDTIGLRYFSSPLDFPKTNETMIADINEPDFWDALIALDEALSPVEQHEESKHDTSQNPSIILNRLSQKFKQTPTRFTEKLVSILEDSALSVESPTKPYNHDTSAVSLRRVTGEFRKLCKYIGFIDDESMPSLMNTTNSCFEKTETPENQNIKKFPSDSPKVPFKNECNTPSHQSTPLALKNLFTPKNKILAKVYSPVNRFSPGADDSFMYWENVCNMICNNQGSTKKKPQIAVPLPESPRLSMNEILTICERQMASLDDSTEVVRTSEPCKKTESEVKLKVLSMPRSKSVTKLHSMSKKAKHSASKDKNDKVREKLVFEDKLPQSEIPPVRTKDIDEMREKLDFNDIIPLVDVPPEKMKDLDEVREKLDFDDILPLVEIPPEKMKDIDEVREKLDFDDTLPLVEIPPEKMKDIDEVREKLNFDDILPLAEIPQEKAQENNENRYSDENDPNKSLEKYYERLSAENRREEMKELLLNLSQASNSSILPEDYDEEDKENYDPSLNESSLDKEYEALKKRISEEIEQREFEDDFQMLSDSPQETEAESIAEEDQDCSLLIELAKRRQRCLETAKLMMEIESDDPVTTEDKRCLETLYKLGIQDKTFAEVEDDKKFLKTLNQCLEYKNYLGNQSKPLVTVFQKYNDSPDDLRKRTSSLMNSKKIASVNQSKKASTAKKPSLEKKSTLRILQEKKLNEQKMTTPRLIPKNATSKLNPKVDRTPISNLKNTKTNSRVAPKTAPKVLLQHKNTLQAQNQSRVLRTPSLSKPTVTTRSASRATLLRNQTPRLTPTSPKPKPTPLREKRTNQIPKSVSKSPKPKPTPLGEKRMNEIPKSASRSPKPKPTPLGEKRINQIPKSATKSIILTPLSKEKPTPYMQLPSASPKQAPEQVKKATPRVPANIFSTPESDASNESPVRKVEPSSPPRRPKFFFTPGKSPTKAIMPLSRKKPTSYFADVPTKKLSPQKKMFSPAVQKNVLHRTPQKTFDSVKSPISLYIKATDNDLVQNVQGKINDRLLTPVSKGEDGQSPLLKFRLASKENQSPAVTCDENIVLPAVRYQSAKKVRLIDENQPTSITPNSRTKKLLESVENTLVIRHEGRVVEAFKPNYSGAETSIRVQKVAEKASSLKKLMLDKKEY